MSKELGLRKALEAINDGYPYKVQSFSFNETRTTVVLVENPDYQEDNGKDPYLCFEVLYND